MLLAPSETSSTYAVYPTYPPLHLLGFNPWRNPQAPAPQPADHSLARPFNISAETYQALLNPAWPITVACLYMVIVWQMNRLNSERGHKPWAIVGYPGFAFVVIAHNVALAVYSGWTFAGMLNAIMQSWPGWDGEYGLAGCIDALCKINGPRGFGSAATYDMSTTSWSFTDRNMKLLNGKPDSSDVGRIWNEGLAYYGFLFYLSKMYEVVDTAIVLAKGKKSSRLQSYHHAGAMICVWAGIRYMSPPIWMFTFINSGIHTLMYTYYAVANTVKVPRQFKQILTTMQITQIVFGTSYALLHLFIAYEIPVSSPYAFSKNLSTALPALSSAISTAATSLARSADFAAWLKKAALRAAGEEGLAENVRNYRGETFGIDAVHAAQAEKAQEEIRYRLTTQKVHCLDTSGEVFAILINAFYLVPLTILFCKFFYNAYVGLAKQGKQDEPIPSTPENIKISAKEAVDRVQEKIRKAIEDTHGDLTEPPPDVKAQLDDLHTKSRQIAKNADEAIRDRSVKAKEEMMKDLEKMQERLKTLRYKGNKVGETAVHKIREIADDLSKRAKEGTSQAQQSAQALGDKAKGQAGAALDAASRTASDIKQGARGNDDKTTVAENKKEEPVKKEAQDAAGDADGAGKSANDAEKPTQKEAESNGNGAKDASKEAADGVSRDMDDSAKNPSDASKDDAEAPTVKDEDKDKVNGTAEETKDQSESKKEDLEQPEPSTSTEDDQSIQSTDTSSKTEGTTPDASPERSKKNKNDKKEGKK